MTFDQGNINRSSGQSGSAQVWTEQNQFHGRISRLRLEQECAELRQNIAESGNGG